MLFVLIWLILFAQVWWVCEGNPKWKKNFDPQCHLGTDVAVAQLISTFFFSSTSPPSSSQKILADVICDAILIFSPLFLVWRSKLSRAQRIRLTVLFSTTFIMTAVSLNHAYFILKVGGSAEVFAGVLEVCHRYQPPSKRRIFTYKYIYIYIHNPSGFPQLDSRQPDRHHCFLLPHQNRRLGL